MWLNHFSQPSCCLPTDCTLTCPYADSPTTGFLLLLPANIQYDSSHFFVCRFRKGQKMKRLLSQTGLLMGALLVQALPVLANAPAGEGAPDYSGISGIYYTLIGAILAYGVYDTFFKKS